MFLYYFLILPLSWLPYRILYIVSDILYVLLYRIFKYRKKVVLENLSNSFPEKTYEQKMLICSTFYKHLCDIMVETIKGFSVSKIALKKRSSLHYPDGMIKNLQTGKSVIVAAGHYNNWEFAALAIPLYLNFPVVGLYKPLTNKFLNHKITHSRSKTGINMISIKDIDQYFLKHKHTPTIYLFLTDQSPSNPNNAYWLPFLNQQTPVLKGVEKYSVLYDYPVYYGEIQKSSRGKYDLYIDLITETPQNMQTTEITRLHTQRLENTIVKNPSYWLWSHKRWKHKKHD